MGLWTRTPEWIGAHKTRRQKDVYDDAYRRRDALRWILRFDIRYRCRRLREVSAELGAGLEHARVLDVGFGGGHLLRAFPASCTLHGAEVSRSAVERARKDDRYGAWADARFECVPEGDVEALPQGPFDVVVSSHTIEHVPDDAALLSAIERRLEPGGLLFLYVPIEEPNYNPDHVRNYSVVSITERVASAGFFVLRSEGSMQVNGHLWKLITIPSRRRWPLLKPLVDTLRLATLSMLPYAVQRVVDQLLGGLGVGPRQALVVARKQTRPLAQGSQP